MFPIVSVVDPWANVIEIHLSKAFWGHIAGVMTIGADENLNVESALFYRRTGIISDSYKEEK